MMVVGQTLSLEARRRGLRDSCNTSRNVPVLASGGVAGAMGEGSAADKTGKVAQQQ